MAVEQEEKTIEILLVEPNPGDTRLFAESFKDAKLTNQMYTVSDGDTALDFLHQQGEYSDKPTPDLILLEPRLPGKDGLELLSELNNDPMLGEIPVVILTTSEFGEEIVKSHDISADCYIRKPVEPEDFIEFVQDIEEFWLSIIKQEAE